MKLLALLPLLFIVSCQEGLGSRSLVNDTAVNPAANTPKEPTVPKSPSVPASNMLHSRCQSKIRCFYSRMPAYAQDDSRLESYVGSKIGQSNYRDTGLCAPTAAAIMLKAVLDERDGRTRLNNAFLQSLSYRPWYESIYQIGLDSETDFRNGGTFTYNIFSSFQNYFQNTVPHKDLYLKMEGTWAERSKLSNQDIINLIKAKKPAIFLAVDALYKNDAYVDGVRKIWHEPNGSGHTLVVKGFDGDRLHIQDPWGMDHFARIQHQNFANSSRGSVRVNSVFTDFSPNPDSFMGAYGVTKKISLDEVMSLSLD